MTSRDRILQRLRQATPSSAELPPVPADESLFRDLPAGELAAAFAKRLGELHGEVFRVADLAAAAAQLAALLPEGQPALIQPHPLLDRLRDLLPAIAERLLPCPGGDELGSPAMAAFEAGVTVADWLVARTGSIVVTADRAGGRRLSVLPPLHIVVATEAQLVPSLDEALAQLTARGGNWSLASVISGPSRTADIEKILVLGAHGPKRLAVILIAADTVGERPNHGG